MDCEVHRLSLGKISMRLKSEQEIMYVFTNFLETSKIEMAPNNFFHWADPHV